MKMKEERKEGSFQGNFPEYKCPRNCMLIQGLKLKNFKK